MGKDYWVVLWSEGRGRTWSLGRLALFVEQQGSETGTEEMRQRTVRWEAEGRCEPDHMSLGFTER